MSLGEPPKPVPEADWENVEFLNIEPVETDEFKVEFLLYQLTV